MDRDELDCEFSASFRHDFARLLSLRRDVRSFDPQPLAEETLNSLLDLCALAPSVGLSQPSRFVVVENAALRAAVRASFERCNREALGDYGGERAALYARMKLAGLSEAPHQLAVFADMSTVQGHGLGRRTMTETLEYSVAMAIHTLWLTCRSHGVGLGWVSIIDPSEVKAILQVPDSWKLIAYLCIGRPREVSATPELVRHGWERRQPTVMVRR